jgi:hypothetical protein
MRSAATSFLLVLVLPACGGGDLTLPGPGDPATLTIVGGDGQQAQPGELVPDPLIVALQDGVGQPIAGRVVAFRFLDDFAGAAIDPGEASTDEQGRVSVRVRLGQETGAQPIEAMVATAGEDLRVRFGLTAQVPPPPRGGGGGGDDGGGGGGGNGGGGSSGGGGAGDQGGGGQGGGGGAGDQGGGGQGGGGGAGDHGADGGNGDGHGHNDHDKGRGDKGHGHDKGGGED